MSERTIFLAALAIDDPARRAAYLVEACGPDTGLRQHIENLLSANVEIGSFLQQPAEDPEETSDHHRQNASSLAPAEGPGARLGPYKLLQKLGEGGMGTVYMAEQEQPVRRRVALKIIKAGMDSAQVSARFEAERQALALMDHPNIARVLDAGATPTGRPYFVMELVKGVPITTFCDSNHLTHRERLEMLIPVCHAIQHAHQKGIIHRDIKPSNVMVTLYDGTPVPKVIDFGVAKAMHQRLTERTLFTQFGQMVGTLEYMSPEQAERSGLDVDTRSDVYSLGVLVYEMLTGSTPLERRRLKQADLLEALRLIREEEPPRPSTRLSTTEEIASIAANRGTDPLKLPRLVRGELDWIVMKCLEKNRSRRYQSVNDLALDVQRFLNDEPVEACPPSMGYRLRKFAHKYRKPLTVAGGLALVLVVGIVVSLWQAVRANAERDNAVAEKQRADQEAAAARAVNAFLTQDVLGQATISAQAGPDKKVDPQLTVRAALDRAAQTIGGRFPQQRRVEVTIRRAIGAAYDELSDYSKAHDQLQRAYRLARESWGDEDPETLSCALSLGNLLLHQGQLEEADRLHAQTLEVTRRVLGDDHPTTLEAFHNVAQIHEARGRYPQAEALFQEVLDARLRVLGEEHPDTLRTMNALAAVYQIQEKPEKDEPAERLHAKVFEISQRVFGEEHPDTLRAMDDLLVISIFRGKFAQAESLGTRLVEISRRAYGERSTYNIEAVNDLALLYQEQGRFKEAEFYYAQALERGRAVFGENSPTTLIFMLNLAKIYHDRNKLAQAEPLCRAALEGHRKVLGADHPKTVLIMNKLARIYQDQSKFDDADALFVQVVAIQRRKFGTDDRDFADALGELIDARLARKAFAEAEVPLKEHLETCSKKQPYDWPFYDSRLLRGASLAGQQKFAEAEPFLVQGVEGLKALGRNLSFQSKNRLARNLARLIQLYEQSGRPDQAAKWRAKQTD